MTENQMDRPSPQETDIEHTPASETPASAPEQPADADRRAEHLTNPRLVRLMEQRDEAEKNLQEALLDVASRESDPAFHEAQRLYEGLAIKSFYYDSGERNYRIGRLFVSMPDVSIWLLDDNQNQNDVDDSEIARQLGMTTISSVAPRRVVKYLCDLKDET